MADQVAVEGGQITTLADAPPAQPANGQPFPTESGTPSPATIPPLTAGQPMQTAPEQDRDAPRFSQRDFDHLITQRLGEERQRVSKDFEAFKAEVAPQLEEARKAREGQEQAERDKMTATQKLEAGIADRDRLLAEKDARLATAEAAMQEVRTIRRHEQIDAAIDGVTPAMLSVTRDHIHRQFADVADLDVEQVAQAAQKAKAEVQAMLEAAGIVPPGTQIGSPGSPPAEQIPDQNAHYEELLTRAEAGDNAAAAELQAAFR